VTVHEGTDKQMNGTWELVKEQDGQVEINLIRDEEATPATVEFVDKDSVAIIVKNERAIVFSRESAAAITGYAAQLVGTWEFDGRATDELETNNEFSQAQLDEMIREASGLTITFNSDGSFAVMTNSGGGPQEVKGKWKASNVDEANKTMDVSLDAENAPALLEVTLRDDGNVCIAPPGQPGAVFAPKFD
jgi:hypothetical protein